MSWIVRKGNPTIAYKAIFSNSKAFQIKLDFFFVKKYLLQLLRILSSSAFVLFIHHICVQVWHLQVDCF